MMAQMSHVMTLANSIIGVSVLAMPFCFKQCGIVLATLLLLFCSMLSRLACHFLVKSAVMSRRRNFELLAFHAFGHLGKFIVELFIIGFLVGTCIAFFVVVGDLGPQIVGKLIDKNPESIRTSLLITTSAFIVLPLGLLRNIDSLSSVCTATIVFYGCLVLKVVAESTQHIFAGDWYDHVHYWRPAGILQCLPIFSMALFCQTQLFEIYEAMPNATLEKMNDVVRGALNICTLVYLCVGFFGYIAFCTIQFTGNILMVFETSLSSDMIKMGFVFSVAFSFPLVIFPCRASLNSLLFRRVYTHEPSINYMPETRFRCLTIAIVGVSLITGILIPNIEFVLGLVGSTIGVMICLIFPAAFFIAISSKNTNERLLAQGILFIGMWIMVLGTYANVYAMEESTTTKMLVTTSKPLSQINNLPLILIKEDIHIVPNIPQNPEIFANVKEKMEKLPELKPPVKALDVKDIRQEPPIPVERVVVTQKPVIETQGPMDNLAATFAPEIKKIVDEMKSFDEKNDRKAILKTNDVANKVQGGDILKMEEKINMVKQKDKDTQLQKNDNLINSDAIKKEDSELAADGEAVNQRAAEIHEFRKTLEKHIQEQSRMMQEQRELLKDIKVQKQEIARDKMRKTNDAEEIKINDRRTDGDEDLHMKENDALKVHAGSDTVKQVMQNEGDVLKDSNNLSIVKAERKFNEANERIPDEVNHGILKKNNDEGKSILRAVTQGVPTNEKLMIDPQEVQEKKINQSDILLKGPILNALSKRTSDKSVPSKDEKNPVPVKERQDIPNKDINPPEKQNVKSIGARIQDQYSIPIALKMRNQTKAENDRPQDGLNRSEEGVQLIRRDILENHDRDKRDVRNEVDTKITKDQPVMAADREKCSVQEKNIEAKLKLKKELDKNTFNSDVTASTLIKTNAYLSEQRFPNVISVDKKIDVRAQYVQINQRDLKVLESDGNREI